MFIEAIDKIATKAQDANERQNGDYINEADGLLYCGKCHTPKQCVITVSGIERVVFCLCKCRGQGRELARKRAEDERIEANRKVCFGGSSLIRSTFEQDDGSNKTLMQVCHAYSDKFSLSSRWLLLYGDCGTGKSFAAACICNSLISRGYSARFVTISEIEKELFSAENKAHILSELNRLDLLCIDDFGAERGTEYMQQIVFDLVDSRSKSGKPCVITTNLAPQDFSAPKSFEAKRIYSRLLEKAISFEVKGSDRRLATFRENNKARLAELLAEGS